ncbi:YczE/YyaS/YitT family protein [Fictibacillus enclensis]|uniref:YczE/YyaS/YitT family protein n=1 Tax=Fictibacillus enclensis TaxID=1017270 RepID=UPI0024C0B505|nr:YitT family protein [Fictibacillus enclensis]WHY73745.1 YitT family protein [Fictibacillus enclensis]
MTCKGFVFYFIGILILTLGIALSIISNLGTSPYDAFLVGLFRTIGLTVGSWEIIIALVMMGMNGVLLRKRPEFLALGTAIVTGAGIDAWYFSLRGWMLADTVLFKLLLLVLGMLLIGIGTALYLQGNIAPIPLDRLMLILQEKLGLTLSTSRLLISMIVLSFAYFLHGPIGVGTLLTALFNGWILSFFMPRAQRLYRG